MPASISHYRRILLLLWLTAAALLGLTWWHVFALVGDNRAKELANTERDLANLTRVSQEHANRTFRGADQVIRFIQARYLELGDKLDLMTLTHQGVIDAEIFPQVGVIDANGIYILANRPVTGKLDLSDREHFKVHVTSTSDVLFVSQPVLGRATGKWSIQLTRRISRPNGDFAGVVVVSIDPGYFTRFYKELKLGNQGVMALYGLDGVARARSVGVRVGADQKKVQMALLNVLSNAYKYSASDKPVHIAVQTLPGEVVVCVADQGVGMRPEQAVRVGERFYRADSSGKVPGTGLGMSIVKEIMALHYGRMELGSAPGQGTTVRLIFPAGVSAAGG